MEAGRAIHRRGSAPSAGEPGCSSTLAWRRRVSGANFHADMTRLESRAPINVVRALHRAVIALGCVSLVSPTLRAQTPHPSGATFEVPAWAFPMLGSATAPNATGTDTGVVATVPTSRARFTVGGTRNRFHVADWNPATHRAAPPIVMHGRKPAVMACGFCHLADGRGRPENA